jgi:hypothetical protein
MERSKPAHEVARVREAYALANLSRVEQGLLQQSARLGHAALGYPLQALEVLVDELKHLRQQRALDDPKAKLHSHQARRVNEQRLQLCPRDDLAPASMAMKLGEE